MKKHYYYGVVDAENICTGTIDTFAQIAIKNYIPITAIQFSTGETLGKERKGEDWVVVVPSEVE